MSRVKTFAEQDEELIEKIAGNPIGRTAERFLRMDAAREMAVEKNKLIRELAEIVLKLCTFPTQDEYKIAKELLKRLGIEQEFQGGYDFSNLDLIRDASIEKLNAVNKNFVLADVSGECEHPYAFLRGEEHGNPQCGKCGKMLM